MSHLVDELTRSLPLASSPLEAVRAAIPSQAGPNPAVKRADLHDAVLSTLAHYATCTGGDCGCDVDTDLVENTARDVVTGVVRVLRSAGVRVEEPTDPWRCNAHEGGCDHSPPRPVVSEAPF